MYRLSRELSNGGLGYRVGKLRKNDLERYCRICYELFIQQIPKAVYKSDYERLRTLNGMVVMRIVPVVYSIAESQLQYEYDQDMPYRVGHTQPQFCSDNAASSRTLYQGDYFDAFLDINKDKKAFY